MRWLGRSSNRRGYVEKDWGYMSFVYGYFKDEKIRGNGRRFLFVNENRPNGVATDLADFIFYNDIYTFSHDEREGLATVDLCIDESNTGEEARFIYVPFVITQVELITHKNREDDTQTFGIFLSSLVFAYLYYKIQTAVGLRDDFYSVNIQMMWRIGINYYGGLLVYSLFIAPLVNAVNNEIGIGNKGVAIFFDNRIFVGICYFLGGFFPTYISFFLLLLSFFAFGSFEGTFIAEEKSLIPFWTNKPKGRNSANYFFGQDKWRNYW